MDLMRRREPVGRRPKNLYGIQLIFVNKLLQKLPTIYTKNRAGNFCRVASAMLVGYLLVIIPLMSPLTLTAYNSTTVTPSSGVAIEH